MLVVSQWFGFPVELLANITASTRLFIGIFCLICITVFIPALKQNRRARFWAIAGLICTVPISASLPQGRLLIFLSVAFSGLLVESLSYYLKHNCMNFYYRFGFGFLIGMPLMIHLVASPLLFVYGQGLIKKQMDPLLNVPAKNLVLPEDIEHKKLILINPPVASYAGYTNMIRAANGQSMPAKTWLLSSGLYGVKLSRLSQRVLRLEPENGFLYLQADRLARSDQYSFTVGETVLLSGVRVNIVSLNEKNRPSVVDFHFDEDMDAASYVFMVFHNGGYHQFSFPNIGASEMLPPSF